MTDTVSAPVTEPTPSDSDIDAWIDELAPPRPTRTWPTYLRDLALGLIVIAACVLAAGLYYTERFTIQSGSMEPALEVGETVWAIRIMGDPERGDIVAFTNPLAPESGEVVIKRIVGLPGDMIESRDGIIHIDLGRVDESVYMEAPEPTPDFAPVVVGPGEVFVLGDNRDASTDSRTFGPIPIAALDYEVRWHD